MRTTPCRGHAFGACNGDEVIMLTQACAVVPAAPNPCPPFHRGSLQPGLAYLFMSIVAASGNEGYRNLVRSRSCCGTHHAGARNR